MRACLVCLLVACTDPEPCPEIDVPTGGHLLCHTHTWLRAAGFTDDQLVVDATTVTRDELAHLHGWTAQDDGSLVLGDPSLYATGQHVIFGADGLTVFSFVAHDGTGYVQTIEVDGAGAVTHNGVEIIPR